MSIRYIGLSVLLTALSGCGGETDAKSPDGSIGGPVTDIERLYPLQHNTVFAYATTDEAGQTGIYVIEVARPRATMAEISASPAPSSCSDGGVSSTIWRKNSKNCVARRTV